MSNTSIANARDQLVNLKDCETFCRDLAASPHHGVIVDRDGLPWRIRRDVHCDLYAEPLAHGYGWYDEQRIDASGLLEMCPAHVVYLADE